MTDASASPSVSPEGQAGAEPLKTLFFAGCEPQDMGVQIVVLDRGFVYVGDVTVDADWVTIRNARNIRHWGTTRGLGELAELGPRPETKLDPAGSVRAPHRALIVLIACEPGAWAA